VFSDQVIHQGAGLGGRQAFRFTQDVPALLDGAQDGRIGGWSTDAIFLQGTHQGGFGIAGRGLGEVLLGEQAHQLLVLPLEDACRNAGILFFLFGNLVFILGFFVYHQEAGEFHRRTGGAQ
jgi:hypothetical protein